MGFYLEELERDAIEDMENDDGESSDESQEENDD